MIWLLPDPSAWVWVATGLVEGLAWPPPPQIPNVLLGVRGLFYNQRLSGIVPECKMVRFSRNEVHPMTRGTRLFISWVGRPLKYS